MPILSQLGNDVFSPVNVDGSPRSVINQSVQRWATEIERYLDALGAGSVDPGDLPPGWLKATNTGAGTPNAIEAATPLPVSAAALIVLNIVVTNTGSPVTVRFNGAGTAYRIRTRSGEDVAVGGLTPGIVFGFIDGSDFWLANDESIASLIYEARDEAEAARDIAVTARDEAESARDLAVNASAGAEAAREAAEAAAEVSGNVVFFDTYADASAALGGLAEGEIVEVNTDETKDDDRTRYKVESGALVYKFTFGIIQVWPSGAYRRLKEWGRDIYCILDAPGSPDPTGANDSTAAFQAMVSEGVACEVTTGAFVVVSELAAKPVAILGQGSGNTKLICDGFGAGDFVFNIEAATKYGQCARVSGMSVEYSGSSGGTFLRTQKQADQYENFGMTQEFRDLVLGVSDTSTAFAAPSNGPDVWMDLGDSLGTVVENIQVNGRYNYSLDPVGQPNDTFLKLSAASAILTARIKNCFTRRTYRGIDLGDRVFFFIENCDIASAYEGIIETAATPYGEGWVRGVNINAQHKGIFFNGADGRQISGCTVRRHNSGWRGATYDWLGIEITNGQLVSVKDILLHISENSGAFTGLHYGIQLTNINSAIVDGIRHSAGLDFITRFSNVDGGTLNGVSSLSSATLMRLTDASKNIQIGPASRKSGTTLGVTYQAGVDLSTIDDRSEGYGRRFGVGPGAVVEIDASGILAPVQSHIIVNTNASSATDDLVSITATSVFKAGDIVILRPQSSSRTVVVKHNTGNIRLNGAVDYSMDNAADQLVLKLGEDGNWFEIGRGDNEN